MSYNSLLNIGGNSEVNVKSSKNVVIDYYIGTGKCGMNNPNSLTFDFAPDVLIIAFDETGTIDDASNINSVNLNNISSTEYTKTSFAINITNGTSYVKKSEDGKIIYWYNTYRAGNQFNASNVIYTYIAIGEK